jgi:hypothetical protein
VYFRFFRAAAGYFVIDLEGLAGGFFPTEAGGVFDAEAFHALAEIGVEEEVSYGLEDVGFGGGVEEEGGFVGDFGHGGGVGAGDGAAAGLGFEDGEAEAFVEAGVNDEFCGVVEVEEVFVVDEVCKVDAVGYGGLFGGFVDAGGEPGGLADEDEVVGELRVVADEVFVGGDEADVVFAGLEVADGEDVGVLDAEFFADGEEGGLGRDGAEVRGDGVVDDFDLFGWKVVGGHDALAGEFTYCEDAGGTLYCVGDGSLELEAARGGEVFGTLEVADVVDADDEGNGAKEGGGVLDVEDVGFVDESAAGEIVAKAEEGVGGDVAFFEAIGDFGGGVLGTHVCEELRVAVQPGVILQQVSDVDFIPR